MERDVQEGHGDGAEPVASNADENEATSIGEIIASLVAELGADRAMMWEGYVNFGERGVDGCLAPLPCARIATSARDSVEAPDHGQAAVDWRAGRSGKSASDNSTRFFFARASNVGRRHSGTKFDLCQLWTVVGGMFSSEATVA